jgi:gluconolactonase
MGLLESDWEEVASGLLFPEGPVWNGVDRVVFSDCGSKTVRFAYLNGEVGEFSHSMPGGFGETNGMAFLRDGSLLACDFETNSVAVIRPDGSQSRIASRWNGIPLEAPNDLVVTPDGAVFFSAPGGSDADHPVGAVYRATTAGEILRVADGMAFPNGIALDAGAEYLYVAETHRDQILRFKVLQDGALGPSERFADLSSDPGGVPDGMAFDSAGRLWVTHYSAHSLVVLHPDGALAAIIPVPSKGEDGPTNLCFAGPDLKWLYVTDAGSKRVLRARVEIRGEALFGTPGTPENPETSVN